MLKSVTIEDSWSLIPLGKLMVNVDHGIRLISQKNKAVGYIYTVTSVSH